MAVKGQTNTGAVYEIMVDEEHTRKFAEAIAAVRAGWDAAPGEKPHLWKRLRGKALAAALSEGNPRPKANPAAKAKPKAKAERK